jgi:hypothetical protein
LRPGDPVLTSPNSPRHLKSNAKHDWLWPW